MLYRHGDIMIATIDELPSGVHMREDVILARGESTGHMHRIEVPATAELWEVQGQLYLKVVATSARLVHEEHKPIELPQGMYRVWPQREYSPKKIRPVYD
jgi:hypothetical protein